MTTDVLRDVLVPEPLFGEAPAVARREDGCIRGDLVIADGRAADLVPAPPGPSPRVVLPALVEAHCHLDKCHTIGRMTGIGGNLRQAIEAQTADKQNWSKADLHDRIGRGMDEAIASGCGLLRTHVDWSTDIAPPPAWSVIGDAAAERPGLTVDRSALVGIDILAEPGVADAIAAGIARTGGTLGAFVLDHGNRETGLRATFAAADRYGLALDFHVDEGLADGLDGLGLIAEIAIETGFQGPILYRGCVDSVSWARINN